MEIRGTILVPMQVQAWTTYGQSRSIQFLKARNLNGYHANKKGKRDKQETTREYPDINYNRRNQKATMKHYQKIN